MTRLVQWISNGCPKCGNHFTVAAPPLPQRDGEKRTVRCVQCYTRYQITGSVKTGKPVRGYMPAEEAR